MNRARFVAAALLTLSFAVAAPSVAPVVAPAVALAQAAQATPAPAAPDLHPILAGRKIVPPLRGDAQVEVVWPIPHSRDKEMVVTKVQVKNISNGPIARFTVEEPWYDKSGAVITSGKGVLNGMLQPDEIQTLTITTAYNPAMNSDNFLFSHQNGSVKATKVAKLDVPKDAAKAPAKPATK